MSDDLGSFFAEISNIEESINTTSHVDQNQHISPPITVQQSQTIISKPAEILSKSEINLQQTHSSHPIYTYDFGNDDRLATNNDINAHSQHPLQTAQTPPVALPQVPRQNKTFVRVGAGEVWTDDTLNEWPENDYRIFVGDLGKEINTEHLAKHFQIYKSFAKAKVGIVFVLPTRTCRLGYHWCM
jgi:hypothetical protein